MPKITDQNISRFEVGQIAFVGHSGAPFGTLVCDGSLVSRTTYAKLFAQIGIGFGAGDGLTTFRLPDLGSRSPIGAGAGAGLTSRTLGAMFGEETHLLTLPESPAHTHPATTTTDGAHQHSYTGPVKPNNLVDVNDQYFHATFAQSTTGVGGGHVHNVTLSSVGTGSAHNNMAPCLVGLFVIAYL